jgi:hypothetical protein
MGESGDVAQFRGRVHRAELGRLRDRQRTRLRAARTEGGLAARAAAMADVVTFGIAALQRPQSGAAGHEFRRTALVADDMPLLVGEDRAVRRHRRPAERRGALAAVPVATGKTLSGHLEDLGKALLQSRGPGIVVREPRA